MRIHCLALGGVELTSSTGKLTMAVINAVAEFERDLLIERTQAGLSRARAEGDGSAGQLVSPASSARRSRASSRKVRACRRWHGHFKTSRQTILRIRDATVPS